VLFRSLDALSASLDDASAAIAVCDRDGWTLHVLAETGPPRDWPLRLQERVSPTAASVDEETATLVVPVRAQGRVIAAVLLANGPSTAAFLTDVFSDDARASIGAALQLLIDRNDLELRRRAGLRRSTGSVLEAMAHQITNDLTGSTAMAQLLGEELTDEYARDAIREIRDGMDRAFAVLRDILEFQLDTRAQDGVIDLDAFVGRLLRLRGYAIRELGITLDFASPGTFMPVRVDASGLELAFLEALAFAELRAHGRVNRSIAVAIRDPADGTVSVDITDSGTGETPDVFPKYFDIPWHRSGLDTRAAAGEPDLGLVDSLLRASGGQLLVRGSKTQGTTLSLLLPLSPSAAIIRGSQHDIARR